jgi:putative glutamine amidotransferase
MIRTGWFSGSGITALASPPRRPTSTVMLRALTLISVMSVRIAIPEPTSGDQAYNQRSLPSYLAALQAAGATPVVIPLQESQERVAQLLGDVQGILLPGSPHDVNPQIYGEDPIPECEASDTGRTAVDELLLQDGFNLHKPILAVCYGVQALNAWRNGSLIQDLEKQIHTTVDHSPGRAVQEAHRIRVAPGSRLAALAPPQESVEPWVNSSHHQAVGVVGDNLLVSAVSPQDGVIEAVELDSREHFVLGVQWHPERTYAASALSQAIFVEFVRKAEAWEARRVQDSVAKA